MGYRPAVRPDSGPATHSTRQRRGTDSGCPDQRNAVAEDVAHHGFTAAGALLELGRSEDQYVAVIARRVRTASAIFTRRSQSFGAMTARSMSPAALASPRAIDPNNTTAWTSDPAAALTTSLIVATGSTRALSGATATCCSFVPPGGPSVDSSQDSDPATKSLVKRSSAGVGKTDQVRTDPKFEDARVPNIRELRRHPTAPVPDRG
jgi:hypothetical protein